MIPTWVKVTWIITAVIMAVLTAVHIRIARKMHWNTSKIIKGLWNDALIVIAWIAVQAIIYFCYYAD